MLLSYKGAEEEPAAGEVGMASLQLSSFDRPLGKKGSRDGEETGACEGREARLTAMRVAAGPWIGSGVGLVDGGALVPGGG